jgi:hypothetical protein
MLFAVLGLTGMEAKAQTAAARKHFDKGTQLYKQARYQDAIAEFEAAYKAKQHAAIHFNLAQCHEKLGDLPAALQSYASYLHDLPGADDRRAVEKTMKSLEARLGEKGIQQLRVYSQPPDATVFVDGSARGPTPFSGEFPLGRHEVGIELDGRAAEHRDVTLTRNTSVALDLTLSKRVDPEPRAEVVPVSSPPPLVVAAPPEAVMAAPPSVVAPAPEAKKSRVWTWVGAGVAAAALATGAGFGLAAKSSANQLMNGSPHTGATATALRDGARGKATTANVFYGTAAVAGTSAVALFFVEGEF